MDDFCRFWLSPRVKNITQVNEDLSFGTLMTEIPCEGVQNQKFSVSWRMFLTTLIFDYTVILPAIFQIQW